MSGARVRKFGFQAAFAFVPVCAGIFLPGYAFSGGERYVSPIWSLFFGIGHAVTAPLFGSTREQRADHLFFSSLALPIISSVALAWLAGWLWENLDLRGRIVAVTLLVSSCLPIVAARSLERPPLDRWPTFQHAMSSAME